MRLTISLILCLFVMFSATTTAASPETLTIDVGESWIRVLVYRGGVLSGIGHNHVISSHDINGYIDGVDSVESATPRATLSFPVDRLVIDDAAHRELEGDAFQSDVSDKDRAGTRRNMLGGKLLDSENYPQIEVRTTAIHEGDRIFDVTAEIEVAGFKGTISFPLSIVLTDGGITIDGAAEITHAALGLKPFSAALGMLKVREEMTVRFHIVACRSPANPNVG